ncbi:hypothetical protein Fmac_004374 [Flemingia macrophylla]|uniref:Uncharacterized protein n=1 Tax=Flemingia macrophylla TaxID=520843 RepID=A0ABD1N4T5_9FABA
MKLVEVLGGCKDHPNNKQLPGVCPYCLRDELLKLNNNNNNYYNPTYPLPSPPPQPQLFPSYVSRRDHHRRHNSTVTDSVSSIASFNYELKRSKSIVFASKRVAIDREVNGNNRGSKKISFWSKIFKLSRKNTQEAFT